MTAGIAIQIRARLGAIAAERSRLDDEQRRLMKALEALEPTTSETPRLDEAIQRQIVPSLDMASTRIGDLDGGTWIGPVALDRLRRAADLLQIAHEGPAY